MNIWTRKSVKIANASGYLDRLHDIYVMQVNPDRPLSTGVERKVRQYYSAKDSKGLILSLLESEIFPIKDSYIGFLRKKPTAIDENPKTVTRIGQRLFSLTIDRLIQEATRPKETNRQLGQPLPAWLKRLGYPTLPEAQFEKQGGPAFLEGGDDALKKYAEQKLGCTLRKGIDFVLKKQHRFVIGEAKFITTPGGEQNGSYADVEQFINNITGKTKRVGLLDGYIWLPTKRGIFNTITKSDNEIFSALLLPDYIKSL